MGCKLGATNEISLALRAGRSYFDVEAGIDNYSDYIVAVQKTIQGYMLELRFTDTNSEQFGDREKARIVLSASTTFQ